MNLNRYLTGSTIKVQYVNSGVTPSSLITSVFDKDEALVDSAAMTSSGDGHYYHFHAIPNTPGFYVVQTTAVINTKTFKDRMSYQAVLFEVD